MAICHYDRLSINLYDENTESLSYFGTAAGVSPEAISYDERPLGKGAIAQEVIRSQKPLIIRKLKKRSYWSSVRAMIRAGLTSSMAFPLMARGKILGVVHVSFKVQPPNMKELAEFLGEFSEVVAVAVDNMLAYTRLKESNLNLEQQKHFLMENAEASYSPDAFFYSSPAMKEVMHQVSLIAPTDASVLITGETGTGKDFVARYIHRLSQRREALFVKVNCPALSSSLFESELFGHSKGAFTGAVASRVGRFEMADGGTIFLDEIGELPGDLQAKLLHVLQDRNFERVGDNHTMEVDFRVLAATNRDLELEVGRGGFRSDLYYRLNTVNIKLPPLRQRSGEIPALVNGLNQVQSRKSNRPAPIYTPSGMEVLCRHQWPGNVRELKNLIKRMIIMRPGEALGADELTALLETGAAKTGTAPTTLAQAEKQHIEKALAHTRGRLGGKNGAAKLLGVPRTTLQYRMKKHAISTEEFSA